MKELTETLAEAALVGPKKSNDLKRIKRKRLKMRWLVALTRMIPVIWSQINRNLYLRVFWNAKIIWTVLIVSTSSRRNCWDTLYVTSPILECAEFTTRGNALSYIHRYFTHCIGYALHCMPGA